MQYNDWVAVTVVRGKKDIWSYVTFLNGFKFCQFLTAEKAATVLIGLRATDWKESCFKDGNKEVWRFTP